MADPFNRDASVTHGIVEEVAPMVRRVTCANAGPMTFTGTQSYLVGRGDVAVIDPGPDQLAHLEAILGSLDAGERISHIFVTHSHLDHSPLAARLAAITGAEVLAFGAHGAGMSELMRNLARTGAALGGGEGADSAFKPTRILTDGETVEGGSEDAKWALTAIHTPGHLSNHMCFALEGQDLLFSGDHLMAWATTMVSPPDGDMAAFMRSLDVISTRSESRFLPGHGAILENPQEMIAYQKAHRLSRMAQIRSALAKGVISQGKGETVQALTKAIYTDIDPALLPAAARNVLSSLIALVDTGEVTYDGVLSPDAKFALR